MERVVITGLGLVSPAGLSTEESWASVRAGKNCIGPITLFDPSDYKVKLAAEVRDFDPEKYMTAKEASRMDRYCQLGMAAAAEAVSRSGIAEASLDPYRVGVLASSGIGGFETMYRECRVLDERGPRRVSPLFVPMIISNILAGHIAIRYGFNGASQCIVTACATGTDSIGQAFRQISHGYLDAVVCGGAEAPIIGVSVAAFSNMTALTSSADPLRASIPFDRGRSGFVMGEGAGMVVLESLSSARNRGAQVIAEVAGYGATCDAYHITAPAEDGEAQRRCMADALREGGVKPAELSYINAHGTSTPPNDVCETRAIKALFGGECKTPVSSTKSMTGHMLGAAGAAEAIFCACAIRDGFVPPTIGYREPDPECDLDYVPNKGRPADVRCTLSNSFGFGGHNGVLLLKRFEE